VSNESGNDQPPPADGPGPSGFLHPDAERIIKTKTDEMFAELAKLPFVEYLYQYEEDDADDEDIVVGEWCKSELNSDTSFRESFHNYMEEILSEGLRRH